MLGAAVLTTSSGVKSKDEIDDETGYPGKKITVTAAMMKKHRIEIDPTLPSHIAGRYIPRRDVIILPSRVTTDSLLFHEESHRRWAKSLTRAEKQQWHTLMKKWPKTQLRVWKKYQGPHFHKDEPMDNDEILAQLASQHKSGRMPGNLPHDVRDYVITITKRWD